MPDLQERGQAVAHSLSSSDYKQTSIPSSLTGIPPMMVCKLCSHAAGQVPNLARLIPGPRRSIMPIMMVDQGFSSCPRKNATADQPATTEHITCKCMASMTCLSGKGNAG